MISGQHISRIVPYISYILAICLSIWGGIQLINFSSDSSFCTDYLLKWEVALKDYMVKRNVWPYFSNKNHVEYMDKLMDLMQNYQVSIPNSNTQRQYIYINRKIMSANQHVFLLCFPDKIILYGSTKETLDRIDSQIDGNPNLNKGRFQGYPGKESQSYIGVWKL